MFSFDREYFKSCFEQLVNVPSPTGYYVKANPVLKEMANKLGYEMTFDNKNTAYITVDGQDNSNTVLVGAQMDTLGLIVRRIDSDGKIRVRQLGGVNFHSFEGETVKGEKFMEFYPNEESVKAIVINLFYKERFYVLRSKSFRQFKTAQSW